MAHAELRTLRRDVEGRPAAVKVMHGPPRLHPEAVHGSIPRAEADAMARAFAHLYQDAYGRIPRGGGRRVREAHPGRSEHTQPVQVALALNHRVLPVPVVWVDEQSP